MHGQWRLLLSTLPSDTLATTRQRRMFISLHNLTGTSSLAPDLELHRQVSGGQEGTLDLIELRHWLSWNSSLQMADWGLLSLCTP